MQAGNKYLQQFENYSVMSMGGNVLRFTIPIWVYGEGDDNTYYLRAYSANDNNTKNSYLWYSETNDDTRGSATVHRIASFGGPGRANYDGRKSGGVGYAYLLVDDGAGAMVVRNTYSGQALTMMPGDNTYWPVSDVDTAKANEAHRLEVTRTNTSYGKYTTQLVLDWYIPESLQGKTFYIGLNVCDHYAKFANLQVIPGSYFPNEHNNYFWQWREQYTADNLQSPELFDPYFYAAAPDGSKPKGKAGIAYATYQDVARYSTSVRPADSVYTDQRSGTIVVDMHDTIQTVSATFGVVPNKETGIVQNLRSNRVNVPAYHKIYNFAANEELDDQESVTGDVTLSWDIQYPAAEDIISSDIFEIQRATKADFSDAQSIGMDILSETDSHYEFTDESDNVRRVLNDDSTNIGKITAGAKAPVYIDGELAATLNTTMTSNVYAPGATLYYRIRRGSAAIWNWDESDWMKTTSLIKHDYLAPLSDVQADYTLDPEFEDNRKVHFTFNLNNVAVTNNLEPIEQLPVSYSVADVTNKLPVTARIKIRWTGSLSPKNYGINLVVYQLSGTNRDTLPLTVENETTTSITYTIDTYKGANMYYSIGVGGQNLLYNKSLPFQKDLDFVMQYVSYNHAWNCYLEDVTPINVLPFLEPYIDTDSVKQIAYAALTEKVSTANYGRCSWDKNAKLILVRKYVETGETMEFVIPKDSIKRQEDGSWVAHFTNEAARSCVHYEYSVRLDQSNSTLKVQNPTTQLNPKVINGPDLYRNAVAGISEISATGDKKAVLIQWQPTAGSIDEYTLTRRAEGSTAIDTLSVQTLEGYYDEFAEPGVTYEYTVEASYTCQGTTTKNSATVYGTRLAFGSIAGRVQYEDGTGCYGVQVRIENGDDVVRTTLTDETGAFYFDSLYYTNGAGRQTTYVITPTSQTAVFIFNNSTSTHSASITMDKNNCVVENLYFDNISAVRFSGRVLYKNSSVPVRDANILLNGRLVKQSGEPYKTDVSGNFQINVPQNSAFTLQIVKDGHTFDGDGFVRINGDSLLTLTKALDGVRIWDQTKVRLAGRVVGGHDQAALPLGHGLSKNNLGEDIQLVLELEGDNISWIVRDPDDLTRDTLEFAVVHQVYDSVGNADSVGMTNVHYQKKRIVIDVDPATGEYAADLFPTKYKIIQATARGYATLFAQGKTGETIDLSNAVLTQDTVSYDGKIAVSNMQFSITYRAPIAVTYKQYRYGLEYDYYGEKTYSTKNIAGADVKIELVNQDSLGNWNYLFNAPVFPAGQYQFRVSAHEDYYYNNDHANKPDVVNLKGGKLKVYNGMQETTSIKEYSLDQNGSALVDVLANHVTYVHDGDMALRQLDFSVESEGDYIEAEPLQAYILGAVEKTTDFLEMDTVSAGITLLDVLRDPPGSASYATLEKGTKYHVKFKEYTNYRFGVDLIFKYGNNNEYFIGTYAGSPAAGTTAGVINVVQKTSDWHLPISVEYDQQTQSDYEITTTERISTSSDPYNVGAMADVYVGMTSGVMTGKSLAFRIVDSLSYEMLASQRESGAALVVAQGTDEKGSAWYLMRTEDILVKNAITSTFAYTQEHIIHTIIPNLFDYRDGLLLVGTEAQAKAAAEKSGKYIFWSHVAPSDSTFGLLGSYQIVKATNYNGATVDKVDAANKSILNWMKVIAQNEKVKLNSFYSTPFQTVSVSGGVTQSYSETYTYSDFIFDYWGYSYIPGLSDRVTGKAQSDGIGGFWIALLKDKLWNRWWKGLDMNEKMKNLLVTKNGMSEDKAPSEYVKVAAGSAEFDFDYEPIMDMGAGMIPENGLTVGESKTTSFTIAPSANEHLTFQIFKSVVDDFNDRAEDSRETASSNNDNATDPELIMFGSLVYRTMGGATQCPWEPADSTLVYYPGQPLNYPTLKIENPQIVINKHELSNIPHDGEGYFTIKMWNEIEESDGLAAGSQGIKFTLKLDEGSNPNGLELSIDGVPLSDGREFRFFGSNVITKTVKVRAGQDYDYEDVCLKLESQCTSTLTYNKVCFSVHFMPVSSPVNISMPSDKWIMNTLSPKDETGYYIPVSIDGFDVNYDNFDHIELQYKLVTQPNDAWVNLCSYYAEDSIYQLASGTKRMIENGKIENYRFYGERDPMEQQYNLRAVSFCRHGSGFITKASEVISGTKDTRVPRVFGMPEPANSILGVGDNLLLRFNEAIAGNYLDEDNNFDIIGTTNETDITTGVSLHFDGTYNSYAATKVSRSLSDKSFSIDLMVKPTDPNRDEVFFIYNEDQEKAFAFGKTADNRLFLAAAAGSIFSATLPEPMTAFTRVIATYDNVSKRIRFYAGTIEVTDPNAPEMPHDLRYSASAPFIFGKGLDGNMLEARLWTKALTTDEIADTRHSLTGYERELAAYYPMKEGTGDIINDKANGATLYCAGTSWNLPNGLSLHLDGNHAVRLDGNLLGRSAKQDGTLMFWFKTNKAEGTIFSAGRIGPKNGTAFAFDDGVLYFQNDSNAWKIGTGYDDNEWHHLILTISHTYNNAAIFIDGNMAATFNAAKVGAVGGIMYLGGKPGADSETTLADDFFTGHVDEFVLFEQAWPKSLIEAYDRMSPMGDEMGLMAYLPFEEQKQNNNGIIELVYSPNDQRVFKKDGEVINKVVPLVIGQIYGNTLYPDASPLADKTEFAPIQAQAQLTKMNFDWSFNNDELMININMLDREINKQNIYITVRDVEDLNGNPMASPVTWSAFVDRNPLKWEEKTITYTTTNMEENGMYNYVDVKILNNSGRRHVYTIESLPDWLVIEQYTGAIEPTGEKSVRMGFDVEQAVGTYSDVIYLTDENGLSEPLHVELIVKAFPPYDEPDTHKFPYNMSVCGQIFLEVNGNQYVDTDERDIAYAIYRNECIGLAHIDYNSAANKSEVYLSVHGDDSMNRKQIRFQLWQASTGKVFNLTANRTMLFAHGFVYGCGDDTPVQFTTTGSQMQDITLVKGWNWVSTNLDLNASNGNIAGCMTAAQPWTEDDLIKNPSTRKFSTYSTQNDSFVGTLTQLHHSQIYMVNVATDNTMRIFGDNLAEDSMHIKVRGDGQWSPMPCLFDNTTPIAEALAGYYDYATPGDLVKSHTRFATFTADKRWVGDLASIRPGEGYLFRRMAPSTVTIPFYKQTTSATPKRVTGYGLPVTESFSNPNAATNMTMIATINGANGENGVLKVFVNDELAAVASPLIISPLSEASPLYFLTIQSDHIGKLRFECDGETLMPEVGTINYSADSHCGSLKAPIVLRKNDNAVYKILENDHVVIIRNGERYDVTGKKLNTKIQ